MEKIDEQMFKILVVGEPGVGKTSLVQRYVNSKFSDTYKSTIGVDFANKRIKWDDNTFISLQLWDLAGQERLGTQIKAHFRETDGVICVYSVTDGETFNQAMAWKNLIDANCTHWATKNIYSPPTILLANKIDLIDEDLTLNTVEIDKHAKEYGFTGGVCTSVKSNIGVDEAMKLLITTMIINREDDINSGIIATDDYDIAKLTTDDEFFIREGHTSYSSSCNRC